MADPSAQHQLSPSARLNPRGAQSLLRFVQKRFEFLTLFLSFSFSASIPDSERTNSLLPANRIEGVPSFIRKRSMCGMGSHSVSDRSLAKAGGIKKKRGAWQNHTRLSIDDESIIRVPQGSPPYRHNMSMPDYKIIYCEIVKSAKFLSCGSVTCYRLLRR